MEFARAAAAVEELTAAADVVVGAELVAVDDAAVVVDFDFVAGTFLNFIFSD